MSNTLLVVFTGILALAILMQSLLFLLTYLNLRRLSKDLLPHIQKLTKKTETTLAVITDIAENIRPVAQNLAESAEIMHNRVVDVDGFLGEFVEKSRREIAGIEDLLHEVTQRFRGAVDVISDNVLMPINRINALTKAVRVAVGVLFRRREKTDVSESSNDDTIFF
jgi:hypothetical protein